MHASELRRAFTGFFADRGHTVVPSGSLIPHDPTVLFTIAGMVPFKPYFTGEEPAPWPRATSIQKCVRAGGKQNDLDEIGRTTRHLSFFEMLGNFSFGDYFKDEAIPYAWEFVTGTLGLDPSRLWVTVHVSDDDAERIWKERTDVDPSHIQRLDADNFWRMGDVGPCGPSSEIFWDKGSAHGPDGGPAHGGEERFVEIWNLVFMQFSQHPDGSMTDLPKPSIDTGAGLERMLTVLQGVDSVFDVDELRRLVTVAEERCGTTYGAAEDSDVSLRIVAEHARTMTFLVSDGVFPSNEDRGYVLRRIIRRAVRHAYLLGVDDVVLPAMVDAVVEVMAPDYPELADTHAYVRDVIGREEERFRETLSVGSTLLADALDGVAAGGTLAGTVAFQLHDTYGFPLEVTEEVAAERGVVVDLAGFDAEMAAQRDRARAARKEHAGMGEGAAYAAILERSGPTEFTGRAEDESDATVVAVLDDAIVLDRTPFYAESGGQVGDTGVIETPTGRATVIDTTYGAPGVHRHVIGELTGELREGQSARAAIDVGRRAAIRRNHTGTHILHWALREVLGDHVKQQGSLVAADRLRFDFSHYDAMTPEEVLAVEELANREILDNATVRHFETTRDHATELGAIAFFGEKYGDLVRVLEAGEHSVELCGGTHVHALGDIGPLKIISEGSIGSNIRRVEAVTGTGPIERLRRREATLAEAAQLLGVGPDELVGGIEKRLGELASLRDEIKGFRREAATAGAASLVDEAVDGVVVARIEVDDRAEVRDLAVSLRDRPGIRAVVLGSSPGGKGVALAAAVDPAAGLDVGALMEEPLARVGGGGGEGAEVATAGGRDASRLDEALAAARATLGVPAR